eukprot:621639-Prorocentrum_minimum.AAC.1
MRVQSDAFGIITSSDMALAPSAPILLSAQRTYHHHHKHCYVKHHYCSHQHKKKYLLLCPHSRGGAHAPSCFAHAREG